MPNIVSTDSLEFNAAFSPDRNSFYFSRSISKQTRIFVTTKSELGWSPPEPAPFSSTEYSDADPAFSPSGELYFISNRPSHANDTTTDYDIWKVVPLSPGKWSNPINVKQLNSEQNEFYISFTKKENVYFASSRKGGYGEEDIYFCERIDDTFGAPKNLGDKINTVHSEYDPFITSDESALIFTSSGRKDGFGKADLYWSVKEDQSWIPANHFDESINTATRDFCPYITGDQKIFFYSSMSDVKFIRTEQLPQKLKLFLSY
jgi:hypothetical protein